MYGRHYCFMDRTKAPKTKAVHSQQPSVIQFCHNQLLLPLFPKLSSEAKYWSLQLKI